MADTTQERASAPRKRGPRGAYAKTGARRRAILDAALDVFAQSGFRAGSLREIAGRVGMSEAGLLHHFRSKSALLQEVLDRRDERSLAIFDFNNEDGMVALRGLVELAGHNASIPGVVELYCTLSAEATAPDHPAHAYFVRRYVFTRRATGAALQRLAADGRLRADVDPQRAAASIMALMDGLQVQWLLDRSAVDMPAMLEEFLSTLVVEGAWEPVRPVVGDRSGDPADDPSVGEGEGAGAGAEAVSS